MDKLRYNSEIRRGSYSTSRYTCIIKKVIKCGMDTHLNMVKYAILHALKVMQNSHSSEKWAMFNKKVFERRSFWKFLKVSTFVPSLSFLLHLLF